MAHRGWARLLLDRARNLIIYGPAHRGANSAAMPTDGDDKDCHFFFNHSERGLLRRLGARSLPYRCLDPLPLFPALRLFSCHIAGDHSRSRCPS